MNYWKWSNGEPYNKSIRQQPTSKDNSCNQNSNKDAIQTSLDDDIFFTMNPNSIREDSMREELDTKLADRELISQRGVNPFSQTSYVNDITARDMFLKPVNTTQGRSKQTETNME
jgi:hypothetical protein